MSKRKCGVCGIDPAEGFASSWTRETGEVFYCHGDDEGVSCYERASWSEPRIMADELIAENTPGWRAIADLLDRDLAARLAAPTQDPTP